MIHGGEGSHGDIHSLLTINRVLEEGFAVESSIAKIRDVVTETLQAFGERKGAGVPIDHAALGKCDSVLEIEIGMNEI